MFEEMAKSASQWLLIIFSVVVFFIVVYGALWLRASRQVKA
ncbi:MAG: hypothetical protein OEY39_02020 [Candidatus Bathyarchaeota archaeon]|nr:hypothetical protein [Candidatus Bathyarchaeota archaeon]MDH5623229.1 hypothetical protein [Candidatus Bathyarchaeota archaeon]MDH5635667.1 hypothetical protein [Candidatus Bathyarchaeota archaeon]MDH5701444.1 hypothetical protein [Candidatus Bathyarchaeota archaeon]